jgi:hypothetical protein
MPDEPATRATAGGLNDNHQRRLIVTCQYIDGLLATIDTVLATAGNGSPFGQYADDLVPAQKRVVEDSVRRIRAHVRDTPSRLRRERHAISAREYRRLTRGWSYSTCAPAPPCKVNGFGRKPDDRRSTPIDTRSCGSYDRTLLHRFR